MLSLTKVITKAIAFANTCAGRFSIFRLAVQKWSLFLLKVYLLMPDASVKRKDSIEHRNAIWQGWLNLLYV